LKDKNTMDIIINNNRDKGYPQKPEHELNDYLFDYLDSWDGIVKMDDYKPMLDKAGFDTDYNHYICVKCTYLPFRHYIHKIEKWIL